jgi:hypothetical protein
MEEDRRKVHALAYELKDHFEEQADRWMGNNDSFFSDIFNHALAHVDWLEIAESLLEDSEER